MNPLNFKRNLKYLRERAALTQEQMARALGVTPSALGSWEEGRAYPNVPKLVTLCERMGLRDIRALLVEDLHAQVQGSGKWAGEVTRIVSRLNRLGRTKPSKPGQKSAIPQISPIIY